MARAIIQKLPVGASHCPENFADVTAIEPLDNPQNYKLPLFLFFRSANKGSERLKNLLRVTQLGNWRSRQGREPVFPITRWHRQMGRARSFVLKDSPSGKGEGHMYPNTQTSPITHSSPLSGVHGEQAVPGRATA